MSEPNIISKIRKTNFRLVSVADSLICLYDDVLGKTVRTRLEVDFEGTIYGKKKEGVVQEICINDSDIYCKVLFQWRQKKGTFGQYLWIAFDRLEFKVGEYEQMFGIFDLQKKESEDSKITVPFHYGQKVKTNPEYVEPYSSPEYHYKKHVGYIHEMINRGNSFAYSLIFVDDAGKFTGAEAWFNHEGLILLEDVTEKSIKQMRQFLRRMDWE